MIGLEKDRSDQIIGKGVSANITAKRTIYLAMLLTDVVTCCYIYKDPTIPRWGLQRGVYRVSPASIHPQQPASDSVQKQQRYIIRNAVAMLFHPSGDFHHSRAPEALLHYCANSTIKLAPFSPAASTVSSRCSIKFLPMKTRSNSAPSFPSYGTSLLIHS